MPLRNNTRIDAPKEVKTGAADSNDVVTPIPAIIVADAPIEKKIDPDDPVARYITLKMKVAEQQQTRDVSEQAIDRDLKECEDLARIEIVTPYQTSQLIHELMAEVITRSKVSKKFKKDLANTHCRVLLSLFKRQKLLGPRDLGITLAMIKQDITPKYREYVEAVLEEGRQFGIIVMMTIKGKNYYSINITQTQAVQHYLETELRGY